jgi:hypothetical protein
MKKEVLIAVILGLLVGGIITYGVYTARQAVMKNREKTNISTPLPSAVPSPDPTATDGTKQMQIESPLEGVLYTSAEVEFKGKTFPGAVIVLFQGDKEHILESDENGNFSYMVTLEAGATYFYTISTSQTGDTEVDKRVVVFSSANLDEKPKQATGSADADINTTKPNLEGG